LKEQEEDPDFNKEDCEFEQLDVCKGGEVVRQNMIMDKDGAIYFMTKASNGTVKVLRTNPMVEMGDD
jgi:general stress protein 26